MQTYAITITGIVQGVGMRPAFYRLATSCGLHGWVCNTNDGVHAQVRGTTEQLHEFLQRLPQELPQRAQVEHIDTLLKEDDLTLNSGFSIVESKNLAGEITLVSPDIATCDTCLEELFDPQNRRYHYPFINCTQCGPRFTIIQDLPYDRPATTMESFAMCPSCHEEYHNPANRRFHAQPDACFDCGPQLFWHTTEEHLEATDQASSDALIEKAAQLIESGGIVAIKGLGGYHLACDATNQQAVALLRTRKRRPHKPFACMVPNLETAQRLCHVSPQEAQWLSSPASPIVLLQTKTDALAPNVAGGLAELGVMLPHTPVQHLLMRRLCRTLVMTSGNVSEEPIIARDTAAQNHLLGIADALLGNNRPIQVRFDDSVMRVVDGTAALVRRSRGFAPLPLPLPDGLEATKTVLACGPEQKSTLCLASGKRVYISQHLGDVENNETWESWLQAKDHYQHLFRVTPHILACDKHPAYLGSQWARRQAAEQQHTLVEVQHHHAHIAAVTAEHNHPQPVVGIVLDGTGYGDDGTVWGGEILVCDWATSQRLASLELLPLPGGAAAVRNPWRIAAGALHALNLEEHPAAQEFYANYELAERQLLCQMVDQNINTPLTSSAGRLFDCISALLGCCTAASYDGQAAMELEALAQRCNAQQSLAMPKDDKNCRDAAEHTICSPTLFGDACNPQTATSSANASQETTSDAGNSPLVRIATKPLVEMVLNRIHRGDNPAEIAAAFHELFCRGIVTQATSVALSQNIDTVALAGGVFANRIVLQRMCQLLANQGLQVLVPQQLPANDGAIAYGQAIVALAQMQR